MKVNRYKKCFLTYCTLCLHRRALKSGKINFLINRHHDGEKIKKFKSAENKFGLKKPEDHWS